VVRRRLTIKRLDPWSVLKFGAVVNIVFFAIFMLVAAIVWFIVDRLQLIDQACEIATDVGLAECAVDGGSLFQVLALLGAMWIIVQTAIFVFLAFLHNLIADLTGGLVIGTVEDGPVYRPTATSGPAVASTQTAARNRERPVAEPGEPVTSTGATGATGSTVGQRDRTGRVPADDHGTQDQQPVGRPRGTDTELFEDR
jgi:hypothetical protein